MRRKRRLLQSTCLLFAIISLLFFASSTWFGVSAFGRLWSHPLDTASLKTAEDAAKHGSKESDSPTSEPILNHGHSAPLDIANSYIKTIMIPEDSSFNRLNCPVPTGNRYDYLRDNSTHTRPKYFFALDLHQCIGVLPRLMGSIVESMLFLGPKNCALSVVEGRSDDGTFEVLKLLRAEIEGIGARYFFESNNLDPLAKDGHDRVQALAELRNRAVKPLVDYPDQYSSESTVVFVNDVALCMEDILELLHQRLYQHADMTCAMDWTYVGRNPTFYDLWIARDMNGDSFFKIPEDGSWDYAWNLFWDNPDAQEAFNEKTPFQVFSCWNGATAFTAKPLLEQKIKFRSAHKHECPSGEPKIFCREMWHHGYGKIAVVPSVNLEYSDKGARKIKAAKGFVSNWVASEGHNAAKIEWETTPPLQIKCIPNYSNQTWVAWDHQLDVKD